MNKLTKIIIATLGGTNEIFSIITPSMLALTSIVVFKMAGFNAGVLMAVGISATTYRATRPLIKFYENK